MGLESRRQKESLYAEIRAKIVYGEGTEPGLGRWVQALPAVS